MLDILDTYIIEKICDNLAETHDLKTLRSLSQTCKAMHQVCKPILESQFNYLKRVCSLALIFQRSFIDEDLETMYIINNRIIEIMKDVLELSDVQEFLSLYQEIDEDFGTTCIDNDHVVLWLATAIPFNTVIIRNGRVKKLIKFILQKYTQFDNVDVSKVKKNHNELFCDSDKGNDNVISDELQHIQYVNDLIDCEEAIISENIKGDTLRIGDIVSVLTKMINSDSERDFTSDYDFNIISCNEGTLILELNNIDE